MKKWLVPALAALGLGSAIIYAMWPNPILVDLDKVTRGPMQVTVDEEGKTRIRERYMVSAPLGGRLQRIVLDPGDKVSAGTTLLAVIEPGDPALLDARTRAEAEARVRAAEASVQQAIPHLERARAEREFAQSEYDRARRLIERNSISKHDLESAELTLRTKTEEFKAAEFSQQIAQYELDLARAALAGTSSQPASCGSEGRFEIRSPIDGEVLHVMQESAGIVTPGTELVEVGDPRDLEIEVDILSSDAVAVRPDAEVILEHWGGEYPLYGRVRRIQPAAFTKVSALGVEEQRVYVLIDFTDPPEKRSTLGDGFRVETRIVVWSNEDALRVPASALFREGDSWAVFVDNNGKAQLRRIKVGRVNAQYGEVLEGLKEGDVVVENPSDKVVDGVAIQAR